MDKNALPSSPRREFSALSKYHGASDSNKANEGPLVYKDDFVTHEGGLGASPQTQMEAAADGS